MKNTTIVTPSSQIESILPGYISQSYLEFVKFMTKSDESEERVGFSQDLLQNLQSYRDFNTYKNKIVEKGVLAKNITATDTSLELENGYGFPDEDGVLYVNDEIIYYTTKVGNVFSGLQRGASGTVILPTFTTAGTYRITTAANHTKGDVVNNISVLFLTSLLETIYESYVPDINPSRVAAEINNATLLENIRDFYQSKGSKLSIKALFKILFAENDVEVTYPGDRMIIPSKSTWVEGTVMRVYPLPKALTPYPSNILEPDKFINQELEIYNIEDWSTNTKVKLGAALIDYATSYAHEGNIQYELTIEEGSIVGDLKATPSTIVTTVTGDDADSIDVESTVGFPYSGIIHIGNEAISYTDKTLNQFLNCTRGVYGVSRAHSTNEEVFGESFLEASITIDGVIYQTYCWVLSLANRVKINRGGRLHQLTDTVKIGDPGKENPRYPVLDSFIENDSYQNISEAVSLPNLRKYTAGISSVYFNDNFCIAGSSGFPYYTVGKFSNDDSIGKDLEISNIAYVIPLSKKNNDLIEKGTGQIGVFVDSVPAYSQQSSESVISGEIASFDVVTEGSGYINPTVIIDPPYSSANATVVDGRVTAIVINSTASPNVYTSNPTVTISSGKGSALAPTIDRYGRVISIAVEDGGSFYNDVPALQIVDPTGVGKGGSLVATVSNGSITAVTVADSGIDYSSLTYINVVPVGSGANVTATVQYYNYNRYAQVINNSDWYFDGGMGFLYENVQLGKKRSTYGYVCNPTELRSQLVDDGLKHSPILGWAFDGNPIYGPYGYTNKKNIDSGVSRMLSGYVVQNNRSSIIPNGYKPGETGNTGSQPPSVNAAQPMGTFTQDFVYQSGNTTTDGSDLTTDAGLIITLEDGTELTTDSTISNTPTLDKNNGRVCNTPDFTEENYPDGVYCYFVTIDASGAPAYPYILGETYQNESIDWYLHYDKTTGLPTQTRFGGVSFEPSRNFDISDLYRFRNDNLVGHKNDFKLDITNVTSGGISNILVESGLPSNSLVGDLLYYDDDNIAGNGALGIVSWVNGETVSSATGIEVFSFMNSHRQILDLSRNASETDAAGNRINPFTFVKDTIVKSWNGAISRVRSYNQEAMTLELQTTSLALVSPNEVLNQPSFRDNLGNPVLLFADNPTSIEFGNVPLGGIVPNDVIVTYSVPKVGIEGLDPQVGDLCWSIFDGRLFVYYKDENSEQWVVTQPVGTTPMGDLANKTPTGSLASDTMLVTPSSAAADSTLVAGGDNIIVISSNAPTQRSDSTALRMGDLWWSNVTGILSVWYIDSLLINEDPLQSTSQWVITDPAGTRPFAESSSKDYAADVFWPSSVSNLTTEGFGVESEITTMISGTAPTEKPDGSALQYGNLFWSYLTGKMYVWWNDGDSDQWTVCNPSGSFNSEFSSDIFPDGPVGPTPGSSPIGQVGELPEQKRLFFDDLNHFFAGDDVDFQTGLPGVPDTTEKARIEGIGVDIESVATFVRGYNDEALLLPNSTKIINMERALYTVTTAEPHKMEPGDYIEITGSDFSEVNGLHEVIEAGTVQPAVVTPNINAAGQVASLTINQPGAGYQEDFVISFFGLSGQGAYYRGIVNASQEGGNLINTEVITYGFGYEANNPPTAILGRESSNSEFSIYVKSIYGEETGSVSYITSSPGPKSDVVRVKVASSGLGYSEIPPALGLYKKEDDRAQFIINPTETQLDDLNNSNTWSDIGVQNFPNGTTIDRIEVVTGGSRYNNPVVIIKDRQNAGTGATATATVNNETITAIHITNPGSGYREPYLTLVETQGKYISLSNDIGIITALKVIDPGKDTAIDSTIVPEVLITTRCIVSDLKDVNGNPTDILVPGADVYQGTESKPLVTANIDSYDAKIQQLTLNSVNGELKQDERIYDTFGNSGIVKLEGEADCRIILGGTSEPVGTFINDQSMLSERYAVIQDSYKYQWFSYNIQSPLQRVQYETFVNDTVHPAGFIMFSELDINSEVSSPAEAEEVTFLPSLSF